MTVIDCPVVVYNTLYHLFVKKTCLSIYIMYNASPGSALMQRFGGAGFCAFVTENALSSVFSFARFFVDFNIHRTNLQALATMDTFIFITMDAQKRKVAHRLKKYRNRT